MSDKFAKTLALLRAERDLTQRELAARVGIAWSMISKYESGQSIPRLKTLLRLADALGVPVEKLQGEKPVETIEIEVSPEQHSLLEQFAEAYNLPLEEAFTFLVSKLTERAKAELAGDEPVFLTEGFPAKKAPADDKDSEEGSR